METRARADALSLTVRPFFRYWVINVGLDYNTDLFMGMPRKCPQNTHNTIQSSNNTSQK